MMDVNVVKSGPNTGKTIIRFSVDKRANEVTVDRRMSKPEHIRFRARMHKRMVERKNARSEDKFTEDLRSAFSAPLAEAK
jgi:hypothetical protein